MNNDKQIKDYLLNGVSFEEASKQKVVSTTEPQRAYNKEPKQGADQAKIQAQMSDIMAEAQTAAQQQFEAIERVAKAASEGAQRIIQSAQERIAIIDVESRLQAQQLVDTANRLIEDHTRIDLKKASHKLLTYVDAVEKEVQKLGVGLQHDEVSVPSPVDSTKEIGSLHQEAPSVESSPSQHPAVNPTFDSPKRDQPASQDKPAMESVPSPQPAVDLKQPLKVRQLDRRMV